MSKLSSELQQKAADIRLVVFDVDGILTDGALYFLADGTEIKPFNVQDGLGIKFLGRSGIATAIITGRSSPQVEMRAETLGIDYLEQGREDKLVALKELWSRTGFSAEQTAYIGDDLPDLSAIRTVAFGATVPNGHPLVQEHADWITQAHGGRGAVRELCETLLDAQGKLEPLLERYLSC